MRDINKIEILMLYKKYSKARNACVKEMNDINLLTQRLELINRVRNII